MTPLFLILVPLLGVQEEPADAEKKQEEPVLESVLERIKIGGQARFRGEYRDPVAYTNLLASREDDDIFLSRIRLDLTFSVDDTIDVFFQPQDQRVFGDEASVASDENNLDVHQGYVDFRGIEGTGFSVRIGRQELKYGDQRIISPLDWSNVGRAWDGIKLRFESEGFWVDGFYTVIREGTGAEDDQDFFGVYASCRSVTDHEFDLYALGRQFNDNSFVDELGNTGDIGDATLGARVKGAAGGFDYTVEGIYQAGDFVDDDIDAWATAVTAGYTFDLWGRPRIGVEYAVATGDEDPSDGDRETFDPLFPFGHFFQGYADVFAFKNGRNAVVQLRISPLENLTVQVDGHHFRLDDDRDAWYNAGGAVIRRDPAGMSGVDIGEEIDVHVKLSLGEHVKFWGGWSHFFPGSYVRDTPGTDRDMDWFFLQMLVVF